MISDNGGDILWCEVFKRWYVYDGTRYVRDETREVERRAETTVKSLYQYAAALNDRSKRRELAEWAVKSESRPRIYSMVESAKRMASVHPTEFNIDPYLLNVLNGTIDLRTQTITAHRRENLVTKRAEVSYDPNARCTLWMHFFQHIFETNKGLIDFVQRLFGYCLLGILTEQVIVILYGTGANGKSTFLGVLRQLAGDYAYHCRPEVFATKRQDSQGFELVPLAGVRVVTTAETGAGKRLDEALVKEMTGGEPISCAPKYGDFFSFQPVFTPIIATNHKPVIRGVNEGIWRRVLLVPFRVTVPEHMRDPDLPYKLEDELSGILNWALDGVAQFLQGGLAPPDEVKAATQEYRAEQDILGAWLEEKCVLDPNLCDDYGDLYQDYMAWCESNKEEAINKSQFSSSLEERGCPGRRGGKGKRIRWGIARKSKAEVTG